MLKLQTDGTEDLGPGGPRIFPERRAHFRELGEGENLSMLGTVLGLVVRSLIPNVANAR